MNIHYLKLSPTGNITVLVTTPVPRAQQPAVAARLLAADYVGGEQAGFIEPPADSLCAARLQMMGGEFCGNATMSLGAVRAREAGLEEGASMDMLLEVSGSAAPVPCRIRRSGAGWVGSVEMPLPTALEVAEVDTDGGVLRAPLVRMPGIAHLILPAEAAPGEDELRRRLPQWSQAIGAEALGALTWREAEDAIDPLVYVPSAGTLVREHGCGSGTAAIGAWRAFRSASTQEIRVRQPGGIITVRAETSGQTLRRLSITGGIALLAEGEIKL